MKNGETSTRALMKSHGVRAKKSLGQNFLTDPYYLQRIIETAELSPEDYVLEIGPGAGDLTERLAANCQKVVAVELDAALLSLLQERLAPYPNAVVIHGDALQIDLANLSAREFGENKPFKVVANLPYYITTPLIMRLLGERLPLTILVLMVQKEVALRMTAQPGGKDYGALSVAVQYRTAPRVAFIVPPGAFMPPPKVESAVIHLAVRPKPPVTVSDEEFFFRVVRAAFAQRRKNIKNSLLGSGLPIASSDLEEALRQTGINPARRGETLSLQEFADLAEAIRGIYIEPA